LKAFCIYRVLGKTLLVKEPPLKLKKIFLLGMSPMPFENDRKVYGTGIRTWQFLEPLLLEGHQICVCNYAIPSAYDFNFSSTRKDDFTVNSQSEPSRKLSFKYNILTKQDFENAGLLLKIMEDFNPDCIIGCSFYPSYIASKLASSKKLPFWADLFGHVMAEAQARAYMDSDDSCLFHYWNSEYSIITAADIFSCVSSRQEYALAGELGAVGRLNMHTSGYDFTCCVPCGMPAGNFKHEKNVIRGLNGIKNDDFIVLWTGGYNTWTDVDTLFDALEIVFEKNPSVKFVSTGGEIPEQDIYTYPRLLKMIEGSRHKDNYIMKGWIPGRDVPNYYFEADIGINIDKDIYEVRFGSKNRILDWMRAGLCVLSSNVCELTEIMQREKAGYTFRAGDSGGLAKIILKLASSRQEVKKMALAGQKYGLENFSFIATTKKLRHWASLPVFAPDRGKRPVFSFDREEALKNLQSIAANQAVMIKEKDGRIAELEAIVKKGFIYRFYGYLKVLRRKISGKK